MPEEAGGVCRPPWDKDSPRRGAKSQKTLNLSNGTIERHSIVRKTGIKKPRGLRTLGFFYALGAQS